MLTIKTNYGFLRHEVVWFASGQYHPAQYRAQVTYFRQHQLEIPADYIVQSEPFFTLFLDLAGSEEEILAGFTKTVRNEIGRAEREGVGIVRIDDSRRAEPFVERHRWFAARKNLGESITGQQLLSTDKHWRLYTASIGDVWLADLLLLTDEHRARQWIAISNLDHPSRPLIGYASKSLVWRSIREAHSEGLKVYDFGGIVKDERDPRHGITIYKKAFGGYEVEESNALVIPNRLLRRAYVLLKRVRH